MSDAFVDQRVGEDEARELLHAVHGKITQAVILGAGQAVRKFSEDSLGTHPTLRAMILNHCIVSNALTRLKGTPARSEYVGNAWRWSVGDRLLFRFKKSGSDGWPKNNYSTHQSLQYVNAPRIVQLSFLPPTDMITVMYAMDSLDEHVTDISILRMSSRRSCTWAYPIYSKSGTIPQTRQETILTPLSASRIRFVGKKKQAE